MKKRVPEPAAYRLYLRPAVHQARKTLPSPVRHRIARSLDDLGRNPRPPKSRQLRLPASLTGALELEVRRLRVENYRVVYAVSERWKEISILAVAKRPPYDYDDLEMLLAGL